MPKNLVGKLSVYLPILIIALWIASYAHTAGTGATVRLKITGYDPRDLLSGHYLLYNVDYGRPVDCQQEATDWCLCLGAWEGPFSQVTEQAHCSEISECSSMLRGSCIEGRFKAGIERYYFSEEYVKQLRIVPPDSSIVVALSPTGKGVVKDLLVKEEPVSKWAEKALK